MTRVEIERYVITPNATVVQAMQQIDKGVKGIVFVVDEKDRLVGCITDGDIRRWLIKTADINADISNFMTREPKYLTKEKADEADVYMSRFSIQALPIVDSKKRIEDIVFRKYKISNIDRQHQFALDHVPVVIMAGGKGTRLYPYTKILPKPLIPIGEVPILERILNSFASYGAKRFYITVNYKKQMIKSYFEDIDVDYDIEYVEEDKPLGTGGSLRLIEEEFVFPIFVTNCDILIQDNLAEIYKRHIDSGNDITIVSSLKNSTIPYGVLEIKEEGIVSKMEEKPSLSYFVNTGMYIINPELIKRIPKNMFYHMTDLVDDVMRSGGKVGAYPISEDAFLDMGELEEMKRMEEKLSII